MTIISISVLTGRGTDKITLYTNLPSPLGTTFSPSQSPLELNFEAPAGEGVKYVRKYFNKEPNIIKLEPIDYKFKSPKPQFPDSW